MSTTYTFAGITYPTRRRYIEAVVEHFVRAGGANSPEQMAQALRDTTDAEMATEALEHWAVTDDVTHSDLTEAFETFRQQHKFYRVWLEHYRDAEEIIWVSPGENWLWCAELALGTEPHEVDQINRETY